MRRGRRIGDRHNKRLTDFFILAFIRSANSSTSAIRMGERAAEVARPAELLPFFDAFDLKKEAFGATFFKVGTTTEAEPSSVKAHCADVCADKKEDRKGIG